MPVDTKITDSSKAEVKSVPEDMVEPMIVMPDVVETATYKKARYVGGSGEVRNTFGQWFHNEWREDLDHASISALGSEFEKA